MLALCNVHYLMNAEEALAAEKDFLSLI